jgi:4-hydroxybenzoyl-CoA thioesterase/acyl-CoA thioester hydrolase
LYSQLTWPRVAVSCEYKGSARFEEDIRVTLRVVRVGSKSFTYEVDFLRGAEKLAAGKITSVCCVMRPDGFTSVTIPADIRAKLTGKAAG